MPRPPFERHLQRRKKQRRGSRRQRPLIGVLVLAVAYSLIQYLQDGSVSWPADVYQRVVTQLSDTAGGENAGWRHIADAADAVGARREGSPPPDFDLTGRVVRISDGDTISVLDSSNKQHKVRLFGIDTPERDQPHGDAARKALADLVADRQVGVVVVETDDYGRTVGTLYRGTTNVNLAMVAAGHAWWYRYFAPHEKQLEAAEAMAREQQLGLWNYRRSIPPWDWRRGRR